jgi:hypothetical protein
MGNVDSVHLEHDVPDLIVWKFFKDGCYSSATAYRMPFLGRGHMAHRSIVLCNSTLLRVSPEGFLDFAVYKRLKC